MATIKEIARKAGDDAGVGEVSLLGDFLRDLIAAAQHRRLLSAPQLAACSEAGARAAAAGIALRALLDLYSSAAWRLWRDGEELADLRDTADAEQVRQVTLWVLRGVDDAVAAVIEGYQVARLRIVRRHEADRHAVVDGLLAGGRAAAAVSVRAGDLGLRLAGPVVVLAVELVGEIGSRAHADEPDEFRAPVDLSRLEELADPIEHALQGSRGDARPIADVRDSLLVVIASAPDGQAVDDIVATVTGVLDDSHLGWRAAVSNARVGPAGVSTSYLEAGQALQLAWRAGLFTETASAPSGARALERVVHAEDVAVYRALLADRDAARQLVTSTLGGLQRARGGGHDLLDTLTWYLETGGNATATAARLHLSVRAVTYRLDRITELIGRDPGNPGERLTLHAAVATARLLGWPDAAEPPDQP